MPMPAQLACYQEMHALSARMVEAAQADDWERLTELEQGLAGLRDMLIPEADLAKNGHPPVAEDLAQKALLIQSILANQDEIVRYTQPKMDEMRAVLGDAASRRRLDQAYDVEQF